MKAIISSTYDSKYIYFLPIVTYCWNKLGVEIICFMPQVKEESDRIKLTLINRTMTIVIGDKKEVPHIVMFNAPTHKEATYAQNLRLYAAALDLPKDEWLITSDVDMAVFKEPTYLVAGNIKFGDKSHENVTIVGEDLVPKGQYPICYCCASVEAWRDFMKINGRSYQKCIDDMLGYIEMEHMRGNLWCRDQETLYNNLQEANVNTDIRIHKSSRSNGQNQFATRRYDRDDSFLLERLNPETIDFHMPRPGYEAKNFEIILKVMQYHYPNEDFTWLVEYTESYKKLL